MLLLLKVSLQSAEQEYAPVVDSDRLIGSRVNVERHVGVGRNFFQNRRFDLSLRTAAHPPLDALAGLDLWCRLFLNLVRFN